MGTRSFVGIATGDKIKAIYIHYDGYLAGVGAGLQEYRTVADVEELISKGDRSSLLDGFYSDRGEDDVGPVEYESFNEFFEAAENSWAEWYYVFKNGTWYCGNIYEPNVLGGSVLYKALVPYNQAVEIEKEASELIG